MINGHGDTVLLLSALACRATIARSNRPYDAYCLSSALIYRATIAVPALSAVPVPLSSALIYRATIASQREPLAAARQ